MTKNNNSTKTDSKMSSGKVVGVIGGIAAAAAVGAYFLYNNKDAKKKIKNIKGWIVRAKGEVLEKVENLKEVNQDLYYKAVDAVLGRYQKLKNIDTAELAAVSRELRGHWSKIATELKAGGKAVKGAAKSIKSKTVKAVTNKPVAKPAAKKPASKPATPKSTETK